MWPSFAGFQLYANIPNTHLMLPVDRMEKLLAIVSLPAPEAGNYLLPRLPAMSVSLREFVRIFRHQAGVTVTPGTEFSLRADCCA